MWTDESRFTLDFHDGRVWVHRMGWHLPRWKNSCSDNLRYPQRRAVQKNIVLPVVIPTAQEHQLIFQDDNATTHRAATVRAAVRDSGIPILPWPARSPDLSPIEHAWDELGRRVRSNYHHAPSTLDELSQHLREQ